jgi:hypothetical protein
MDSGVSIHLGQFQRLAMTFADDNAAMVAWGLVLARIEDDTGRVLADEYDVAEIAECTLQEARLAFRRLEASGAVYSLPREEEATPETSRPSELGRYFVNPHIAFRGTGQAHDAACERVAPPGVTKH